jgi:hypothetical protein
MLIRQAVYQYTFFMGVDFPTQLLSRFVLRTKMRMQKTMMINDTDKTMI